MFTHQPYLNSNRLPVDRLAKLDAINPLLPKIIELVDLQALADAIESAIAPG